jgi:NADPH:quinone reductase-like Zn-dependent oxidoreductase
VRAVRIDRFGGPEVLQLRDVPLPAPGQREVLVRIVAASINPVDIKVRRGEPRYVQGAVLPLTIGRDFSGVVEQVGSGLTGFQPGDHVVGVSVRTVEGSYAEAIAISADLVARKPRHISHADAAASALTGLTAMAALTDGGRVRAGETVFIHGASGGVGTMALQLARMVGASTIASCSAAKADRVRRLGADLVVSYGQGIPACDIILDLVGDLDAAIAGSLRTGGRLICMASSLTGSAYAQAPAEPRVAALKPKVGRNAAALSRLVEVIEAGGLRAPAVQLVPLAEAAHAHAMIEARANDGKIVLQIS